MTYERFPFGKHKGEQITEIPSTYIVYALETFDLPIELKGALQHVLLTRLDIRPPLIEYFAIHKAYERMCKKYDYLYTGSDLGINALKDFLNEITFP
jgi:uncharacterized protein (DUF3820 family)